LAGPCRHADLSGDPRTEPRDQPPRTGPGATVVEDPAQRVEDHRAGDVPVVLQRRPAVVEPAAVHLEEPGEVVENPRTARVDHVEVEIRRVPGPFAGESSQYRRQRLHRRRYPPVENEVEPGLLHVIADPPFGVRYEV